MWLPTTAFGDTPTRDKLFSLWVSRWRNARFFTRRDAIRCTPSAQESTPRATRGPAPPWGNSPNRDYRAMRGQNRAEGSTARSTESFLNQAFQSPLSVSSARGRGPPVGAPRIVKWNAAPPPSVNCESRWTNPSRARSAPIGHNWFPMPFAHSLGRRRPSTLSVGRLTTSIEIDSIATTS